MSHLLPRLLTSLAALASSTSFGCALFDDAPSHFGYRPVDEWGVTLDAAQACDALANDVGGCATQNDLCLELCGADASVMCRLDVDYVELADELADERPESDGPACPTADGVATVTLWCGHYVYASLDDATSCISAVAGRRPAGLLPARPSHTPGGELGDYFADCARLEAASVDAFDALRDELRAHGAPPALIEAAERAADDERRHAALMTALATRHGAKAREPEVERRPPRALAEMAAENLSEGVVRETFGALVALWQARHARDAEVRHAMRQIADDECEHAALAWDVAAWAQERLGPEVDLRRTIVQAVEALAREAGRAPTPALAEAAGLPNASEALALVALLWREAWADALRAEAA